MRARWLFVASVSVAGCAFGGRVPADYPQIQAETKPEADHGPTVEQDEATVAKEARLDALTRVALAKSPLVAEARARAQAAVARVKASGRFPDLELKYEILGQPLNKPWALGSAQMHMFGVRLTLPPSGSLDAQTRIAMEDAKIAIGTLRTRELDVVSEVHKAWSLYWASEHEKGIHADHMEVTSKLLALARVQLVGGKTTQGDLLRFELEVSKIHGDILVLEQQKVTSRARLNALMGRAVEAPLGPPAEPAAPVVAPRIEDVRAFVLKKRPEIAAAAASVKKSEAAVDAANSQAKWPMVMVGLDYQLMPMAPMPHAYGAMVQFSLPWLSSQRSEEVKAAQAGVEADKATVKAIESAILLQVQEALARYDAQRSTLQLVETKLLPQSKKTFDATLANYGAGGGEALSVVDAERTWLQMRIERSRAIAQVEIALADIERALGAPLSALGKKSAP